MSAPLIDFDEVIANFDPVLGLEVHVELGTASKMFCGCATEFGAEPNTQVCPTCLGLPGSLPVVNGTAVESAIRIGLALNCSIASWCRFARKNYFYPDMPKNFQTSQYDEPICFEGYLDVDVDSVSSVYAIFDPAERHRGLGTLTMLLEIQWALSQGKRWLYPGYATEQPSAYDYKKSFRPMEYFDWRGSWRRFDCSGSGTVGTPVRDQNLR